MTLENQDLEEENERLRARVGQLQRELLLHPPQTTSKEKQSMENMVRLVETKSQQMQEAMAALEKSYQRTISFYYNTVRALVNAFESKNEYFVSHSHQVARVAREIGKCMDLSQEEMENLEMGGVLHDFGMIAVRESVVMKQSALTEKEYAHVKIHPHIAELVLEPIGKLEPVIQDIKAHHERFDGTGYPGDMAGNDIPLGGRVLAIADAYQAMSSKRPWRDPLDREHVIEQLEAGANAQFDPDIIKRWVGHLKSTNS